MLDALVGGMLVRPPVTKTGKSGKPYTTALIAVATEGGEDRALVSVIAFGQRHALFGHEVGNVGRFAAQRFLASS